MTSPESLAYMVSDARENDVVSYGAIREGKCRKTGHVHPRDFLAGIGMPVCSHVTSS